MAPVRVGVIGCGRIGRNTHVPALLENSKSRLVAICDEDEASLGKVGDKYGIKNRFRDYRELLASELADAVIICTPTDTHSEIALAAIECGTNVLCEKPLASDLNEAQLVASAVRRKRICFMVGFNYRFLPNHIKARDLIRSGKIGEPVLIRGQMVAPGPYGSGINEEELVREAEKRKGCLFDLGAHIADLFAWMVGDPREVYAGFTEFAGSHVDGAATVLVRFNSEVLGNIVVTWLDLPDIEAMSDSRVIEVIGTKGKIDSQIFGPSLYYYSSGSITSKIRGRIRITPLGVDPRLPDDALKQSYRKEIDCFLEAILNNKGPPATADDGLRALRVVVAAYESAKLGRPVSLG